MIVNVYPVISQLQGQLHKGIWAQFHFLDMAFAKLSEGKNMTVHFISQCLSNSKRLCYLSLNLKKDKKQNVSACLSSVQSDKYGQGKYEISMQLRIPYPKTSSTTGNTEA